MKRRDFIQKTGIVAAGASVVSLSSCGSPEKVDSSSSGQAEEVAKKAISAFELPALPYAYEALEPMVDTRTMTIHHSKHHAGYVKKLNAALSEHSLAGKELNTIIASVKDEDGDIGVRNNGGGHFNHSLFWEVMKPGAGDAPEGPLADAINAHFSSLDDFKEEFGKAAASVFGSGWAWLCVNDSNKLFVTSTPNQDNPLMKNVVERTGRPILGIDVWEHAYYLNYQNRRKDYIESFMKLINWDVVSSNLKA